jgi:hypothetical protein
VEEDPAGVGEEDGLLTGAEGWDEGQEDCYGEDEDSHGDRSPAGVDGEEDYDQDESQHRLGFVGVYGQGVVGGVEHLGEGDEVEEGRGDGGGDGDAGPAEAVVQGRGQDCERGGAVEDEGDSEPEEGHRWVGFAGKPQTLSITWREGAEVCDCCHLASLPLPGHFAQSIRSRQFKSGLPILRWLKAIARLGAGLTGLCRFSLSGVSSGLEFCIYLVIRGMEEPTSQNRDVGHPGWL